MYGIGGSSTLRNGDGNGGGGLGYSLCRGTRTGGNTNKRRKNEKYKLNVLLLFPGVEVSLSSAHYSINLVNKTTSSCG